MAFFVSDGSYARWCATASVKRLPRAVRFDSSTTHGLKAGIKASMKTCTLCREEKPLEKFNRNESKPDGLQSQCRECGKKKSRAYYEENKTQMRRMIGEKNKQRRVAAQKVMMSVLQASGGCKDCGETDIMVLEFDHVVGRKIGGISKLANDGVSTEKLLREIKKCDVVCANDHRRRTYRRSGSHRLSGS